MPSSFAYVVRRNSRSERSRLDSHHPITSGALLLQRLNWATCSIGMRESYRTALILAESANEAFGCTATFDLPAVLRVPGPLHVPVTLSRCLTMQAAPLLAQIRRTWHPLLLGLILDS